MQKAKKIISMEKLSPEILDTMRMVYPTGYERNIMRVNYPSKGIVFVVPLETEDTTYLIKVNPDIIVDNDLDDDDDDMTDDTPYSGENDDEDDDDSDDGM